MNIEKLKLTVKEIKRLKEVIDKEGVGSLSHENWNNLSYAIMKLVEMVGLNEKPFRCPMAGKITAPFNEKRKNKKGETYYHTGIDIADHPTFKTVIFAAGDGRVIMSMPFSSYGNCIDIQHDNGLLTRYAHCSRLLVIEGATVKKGDQIAIVGSTGNSHGPHLHFEVRKNGKAVDPMQYI